MPENFEYIMLDQASAFTPPEIVVCIPRETMIEVASIAPAELIPEWFGDFISQGDHCVYWFWGEYCKLKLAGEEALGSKPETKTKKALVVTGVVEIKKVNQWAWMVDGNCIAHGPFKTREEAIEDARGHYAPEECPREIVIGYPSYANAASYLPVDIDTFLEQLEENAFDNDFGFADDTIFDVNGDVGEAEKELEEVFINWANKWLSSTTWLFVELEKVTI